MKRRLLFTIRSIIAGAIAMTMVSSGIDAVPTIPQGQGEVTFRGAVVDTPCSIGTQSARQEIDFGQISRSSLQEGGESQPKDLNIKLVNCDITNFKKAPVGDEATRAGTVALTFSDVSSGDNKDMLQAVGATSTAIVVIDPHSERMKFDEATIAGPSNLANGDNTIRFTTTTKKDDSGNPVTEGAFSAVANFNLTYQ